jgi:hypothetical protein
MKSLFLMALLLLPSSAIADSRCIAIEDSALVNKCQACTVVTVHELRPVAEQAAGVFTGVSRNVRLEAGASEPLQGSGSWAISDHKACP